MLYLPAKAAGEKDSREIIMTATPSTLAAQLSKVSLMKAAVAAAPRVAYSTRTGDTRSYCPNTCYLAGRCQCR